MRSWVKEREQGEGRRDGVKTPRVKGFCEGGKTRWGRVRGGEVGRSPRGLRGVGERGRVRKKIPGE